MLRGETNELSKSCTAVPFRNLLSILETRVKNKDRAPPNMGMLKITMIRLGLGEYLQRSQSSNVIWDLIEEPDSMLNCKRPKTNVVGTITGPVHCRMYHHVASPIAYGLNVALSDCILMFCTYTREGLRLVLGDAVITKHARIIHTIVAVEVLDGNSSQVHTYLFKSCFAHHCLACTHACLAFHIDKIGGSIGIKGTSIKTAFRAIAAMTIQTSSRSMNNKLISEDFVARFILIELEDAIFCREDTRGLDIRRAKFLR